MMAVGEHGGHAVPSSCASAPGTLETVKGLSDQVRCRAASMYAISSVVQQSHCMYVQQYSSTVQYSTARNGS